MGAAMQDAIDIENKTKEMIDEILNGLFSKYGLNPGNYPWAVKDDGYGFTKEICVHSKDGLSTIDCPIRIDAAEYGQSRIDEAGFTAQFESKWVPLINKLKGKGIDQRNFYVG
jgi:hypothetical protein